MGTVLSPEFLKDHGPQPQLRTNSCRLKSWVAPTSCLGLCIPSLVFALGFVFLSYFLPWALYAFPTSCLALCIPPLSLRDSLENLEVLNCLVTRVLFSGQRGTEPTRLELAITTSTISITHKHTDVHYTCPFLFCFYLVFSYHSVSVLVSEFRSYAKMLVCSCFTLLHLAYVLSSYF